MSNRQDDNTGKPAFIDATRRGFLQGAAVASGMAATGAAVAAADAELDAGEPEQVTQGKGYQLTDHVKTYYKRARF